ncbi:MAG TPA: plastocyanin/azurin family copper-binding protein [Stellaceae bacterium]|nr:plastocyanin/azurin family copper-binding protein [Stellaceae bacterium]
MAQAFFHFIYRATTRAGSERRRALIFAASLPFFMGIGAALVAAADSPVVSQAHRRFVPGELTIAAGTVVHFVNDDNVTHHVYVDAPDMQFDSGEEPIGKSVDLSFPKPGSFTVLCAIHPTMHLKVTVR